MVASVFQCKKKTRRRQGDDQGRHNASGCLELAWCAALHSLAIFLWLGDGMLTGLRIVAGVGGLMCLVACCPVGTRQYEAPTKGWIETSTGAFHAVSSLPPAVDRDELACYIESNQLYMDRWCEKAELSGDYKKRLYVANPAFIEKQLETYCLEQMPVSASAEERGARLKDCWARPVDVQMRLFCDRRVPLSETTKKKTGKVADCMASRGYRYAEQENWTCQGSFFRLF